MKEIENPWIADKTVENEDEVLRSSKKRESERESVRETQTTEKFRLAVYIRILGLPQKCS